jgi:DNA repair exonuclease SbcCD nuclease subunit
MAFRFVHAADIHLDSPLLSLDEYPGAPVEEIRLATRKALGKLVDFSIEREAAFVVIAGTCSTASGAIAIPDCTSAPK